MVKILLLCFTFLCSLFVSVGQSHLDSLKAVRKHQKAVFLSQLFVRELTGHNDGKQINAYRSSVAEWLNKMRPLPPWCAAFSYWSYKEAGIPTKVKSARARDYFKISYKSYDPNLHPERPPSFGDAAGYFFGNNQIRHIGIIYDWNPNPNIKTCTVLEGNTSGNSVTGVVVREGDGVYLKIRQKNLVKRVTPIKNLL